MKYLLLLCMIMIISGCVQTMNVDSTDRYGNPVRERCTWTDFIIYSDMSCKVVGRGY